MRFDLTNEEAQLLHRVLSGYLSDLRMEVAGTDSPSFRQGLKDEEIVIKKLISGLEAGLQAAAS